MLPVSAAFLAAVTGSHGILVGAILCNPPGQTGVNPTGTALQVVDGDVTLDGAADIRGTLSLDVADYWPTLTSTGTLSTQLTPYGAEIFVYRAITYGNGNTEAAPLGYYRITAVEQADNPKNALTITGQDRMSAIKDARFTQIEQFQPGVTNGAMLLSLLSDVYPGVSILWDDTTVRDQTIGRLYTTTNERLDAVTDLMASLGKIGYWRYDGQFQVKTPPSSTAPVWTIGSGAGGVLVGISRSLNRDGVYNAAVVTGQGADTIPPVTSIQVDGNASSPTYFFGPFGKVPQFLSSPLITTQAQADAAAATLLQSQLGLPYSVDLTAVPNPALEPYDPVQVTYPFDQRLVGRGDSSETHVLSQIKIPLGVSGALTANTRVVTL